MAGSGGGGGASGTVDFPQYMKDLHQDMYFKILWNVERAEFEDFPYNKFTLTAPWCLNQEMSHSVFWFNEILNNFKMEPLWDGVVEHVMGVVEKYPGLFPTDSGYTSVYDPSNAEFSITSNPVTDIKPLDKPAEFTPTIDTPTATDPLLELEDLVEKLKPAKYTPSATYPSVTKPTGDFTAPTDTYEKPSLDLELEVPDTPLPECSATCTPTIDIDWEDFDIDLTPIQDMMEAELEKLRRNMLDDILPKYRRGMQNIGAVTVSSFKIGEALLWAEYLKRLNEVAPKYQAMIQQMMLDKYKSLLQAKTQVGIAQANLEMESYKTAIDVWKTQKGEKFQAELAKFNALVDKYKVEADLYKADKQINSQNKIAVMNADISMYQTKVDMYKAELASDTQIDVALLNNQTQTYKIDADIFNTQVSGGTASVTGQAARFSALAQIFSAKLSSQTQVNVAKLQAQTSIYSVKADMYKADVGSQTQIVNTLNQVDLESRKAYLNAEVERMKSSTQRDIQIIDTSSRNHFEQAKLIDKHIWGILDGTLQRIQYYKDVKDSYLMVAKTKYAVEKEYNDAMNSLHLDAARWRLEITKYLMDALGCISGSAGVSYTTATQGSRLGSVVGGALGMAGAGAAAGSFAGPEGMVVGGVAGAALGAIGGLFG